MKKFIKFKMKFLRMDFFSYFDAYIFLIINKLFIVQQIYRIIKICASFLIREYQNTAVACEN